MTSRFDHSPRPGALDRLALAGARISGGGTAVIRAGRQMLCTIVLMVVSRVTAAEGILPMDLPEDRADRSLKRLAVEAGVEVVFSSAVASRVRANAVRGEYSPLDAAQRLLAGTILHAAQRNPGDAIVVTQRTGATPAPSTPPPPPPRDSPKAANQTPTMNPRSSSLLTGLVAAFIAATSSAQPVTPAQETIELPVFSVTGDKAQGYRSTQTLSGTNTLENLRNTPNSISVLNRELMDDLMTFDIQELSFVSITGQATPNNQDTGFTANSFRGIVSSFNLRDGVGWFTPVDSFSIDRVEVLRGPMAFLYGQGQAGGVMNQITKRASTGKDATRLGLYAGSFGLFRGEIDLNKRLNDKVAIRAAALYSTQGSFQNHFKRDYVAGFFAVNYRPFKRTDINFNIEYGKNDITAGRNILSDTFSISQSGGATTAYTTATGGLTYIPAQNLTYSTAGRRRSTGTNLLITDKGVQPPEWNILGPDSTTKIDYVAAGLSVDQRVAKNLNVQLSAQHLAHYRTAVRPLGSASTAISVDINPTLPNGSVNPHNGKLYSEYYNNILEIAESIQQARLTAIYDLDLKITKQRLIGTYTHFTATPWQKLFSETVDPSHAAFVGGPLQSANTLAAYQANVSRLSTNHFYRRFYLQNGDSETITGGSPVAGTSVYMRDVSLEGNAGRLTDRRFKTPAYGFGASGSYFDGRVFTLIGWRHNEFSQDPTQDFFNSVTSETFRLASTVPVHTRIKTDTTTYGLVFNFTKNVAAFANTSEAVNLQSGIGSPNFDNTFRGPVTGSGKEAGLRWTFLNGRLESNWSYYENKAQKQNVNPAIPTNARTELSALYADFLFGGADTQSTMATGYEFETVANLTDNWRLTWNFSKNELETSDRYPGLTAFHARAKADSRATPFTDAFLTSVPDGTPLPGFTKHTSNLVTNYRFGPGVLKGLTVGGVVQYRDRSYIGNYDLNRDGVAEQLWGSGYTLYGVLLGYETKFNGRSVSYGLNIDNVFNKEYYRALALSTGVWGAPRSFRFGIRTNF